MKAKLGFLGAGNMAAAIIGGILKSGLFSESELLVCDVDAEKLKTFENKGISTTSDSKLLLNSAQIIILAIKPQVARTVLPTLSDCAFGCDFISIMAGLTKAKLKSMLGDVKVARIMPNTPCMVGEGMSAIDASDFEPEKQKLVADIFSSLGKTTFLYEEAFDAVTAVSGSGPAYVYMFIDAMARCGAKLGLSAELSKELTLQTFKGAVKMVEESPLTIETLIDNVCSKGGTTIQAVEHYRENNLYDLVAEGMEKCEKRSKELSVD